MGHASRFSRRAFLVGGAGFLTSSAFAGAQPIYLDRRAPPSERCRDAGRNVDRCNAGLNFVQDVEEAFAGVQDQSNWCWAASISSIFRWYDHPVPQDVIVRRLFGFNVNAPATDQQIVRAATGNWVNDRGGAFAVLARDLGRFPHSEGALADQMYRKRPVIIGSRHHATVAIGATYFVDLLTDEVEINTIDVFDPWPTSERFRPLSRDELDDVGAVITFQVRDA